MVFEGKLFNQEQKCEVIPQIKLGLGADQDFSNGLKFLKASKPLVIHENTAAIHGKKSEFPIRPTK